MRKTLQDHEDLTKNDEHSGATKDQKTVIGQKINLHFQF